MLASLLRFFPKLDFFLKASDSSPFQILLSLVNNSKYSLF